jgi:FixJ family two-component response regulator
MKERPATVYIVDDDSSFLAAVSRLLRSAGHSVRTFDCARQFLEDHEEQVPGCLLLDLAMPGLDGLSVQELLFERGIERPIVFLTGRGDIVSSVRAMKRGAVDFLTKPVDEPVLLSAVREALERDREARRNRVEQDEFRRRWSTLTPREREVARRVIAGRLNKQIASELGTVERTVKYHRSHLMIKLNLQSVAELARLAERAGIDPA